MEPVLISFSICLVGVIGAAALFSIAMRGRGEADQAPGSSILPPYSGSFFMEGAADPRAGETTTGDSPAGDALLRELERHYLMEERAAEAFLEGPSPESLHAPSRSPWWG